MAATFLDRTLESVVRRAARQFPAVVLTGPRQSGKTTLLRRRFGSSHRYVSLDVPDVRLVALNDPRSFLEENRPPVILDEVQSAPELLPYVKEWIDAHRTQRGAFLLSGSQNLALSASVTESLAGRAAMLRLLPLSGREAHRAPDRRLPWQRAARSAHAVPPRTEKRSMWEGFLRGGYPEIVRDRSRDPGLWHASYLQTYLERDVRALRHVGDLSQFQVFVRALAARSAQLLDLTGLSRDIGVAVNTVKAWLSVLEATYQVLVVRPYFANVGKRLVKTPKVYFTDLGTLCHLVGLRDPSHAAQGPMAGALFETAVVTEVWKTLVHQGQDAPLYFWRTSTGTEVDLVVEHRGRLIPIEAKTSATPTPAMAMGITAFRSDLGARVADGFVVHAGARSAHLAPGVTAVAFRDL